MMAKQWQHGSFGLLLQVLGPAVCANNSITLRSCFNEFGSRWINYKAEVVPVLLAPEAISEGRMLHFAGKDTV